MITDGFLYLMYLFVYAVTLPIRLLSDVSLPSNFVSSITTAKGYLASLDPFLPITDGFIPILALLVTFETAYFTYKGIMWIIKRFPTQS